jgi:hypothetical protein
VGDIINNIYYNLKSMPVKSATPRVKKALLPSPIITMTEPAVDVSLESKVVPAMAIIASVAMLMAFGSIIAAAAVNMSSMNNPPIPFEASQCTDGDKSNVTLDPAQIYPLAGFASAYGSSTAVKNFDPFTASKAVCRDSAKYVGYIDQCYKDNYGPLGYIGSVAVASCAPTDKRCRVRDGFAYPMASTTTAPAKWAISSWNYLCKNGCIAGACLKDPAPVCTDSDIDSNTGQSNPFMAGSVTGLLNGVVTTTLDYCESATILHEYSCGGAGQIMQTSIQCTDNCIGAVSVGGKCYKSTVSVPLYPAAPTIKETKPNNPPKCTDSDGGKDYYASGTITTNDPAGSGSMKEMCLVQKPGNTYLSVVTGGSAGSCSPLEGNCYVEESFCDNSRTFGYNYDMKFCPKGCSKGACNLTKANPIITFLPLVNTTLTLGTIEIAKFSVTANNGDVAWKKVNLAYYLGNTSTTISNCTLKNKYGATIASTISIIKPNISIVLSTEELIARENTATYSVSCNIGGSTRTGMGDMLVSQIYGSWATTTEATTYAKLVTLKENRFIWSDLSEASHSVNTNDWFGTYNMTVPTEAWVLNR